MTNSNALSRLHPEVDRTLADAVSTALEQKLSALQASHLEVASSLLASSSHSELDAFSAIQVDLESLMNALERWPALCATELAQALRQDDVPVHEAFEDHTYGGTSYRYLIAARAIKAAAETFKTAFDRAAERFHGEQPEALSEIVNAWTTRRLSLEEQSFGHLESALSRAALAGDTEAMATAFWMLMRERVGADVSRMEEAFRRSYLATFRCHVASIAAGIEIVGWKESASDVFTAEQLAVIAGGPVSASIKAAVARLAGIWTYVCGRCEEARLNLRVRVATSAHVAMAPLYSRFPFPEAVTSEAERAVDVAFYAIVADATSIARNAIAELRARTEPRPADGGTSTL